MLPSTALGETLIEFDLNTTVPPHAVQLGPHLDTFNLPRWSKFLSLIAILYQLPNPATSALPPAYCHSVQPPTTACQ